MANLTFSAKAVAIARQIEADILALENGGITCDRCGGQGVCDNNEAWINTRLTDRHNTTHGGRVCFKCKGAGTVGLAKKQRQPVLACAMAYYKSITSDGVIDFGRIVNQYRKWETSVWGSTMQPIYHHINMVVVAKALKGESFTFKDDPLVWDMRCYSFFPYAMQFFTLMSPSRQREIERHNDQVARQRRY